MSHFFTIMPFGFMHYKGLTVSHDTQKCFWLNKDRIPSRIRQEEQQEILGKMSAQAGGLILE